MLKDFLFFTMHFNLDVFSRTQQTVRQYPGCVFGYNLGVISTKVPNGYNCNNNETIFNVQWLKQATAREKMLGSHCCADQGLNINSSDTKRVLGPILNSVDGLYTRLHLFGENMICFCHSRKLFHFLQDLLPAGAT